MEWDRRGLAKFTAMALAGYFAESRSLGSKRGREIPRVAHVDEAGLRDHFGQDAGVASGFQLRAYFSRRATRRMRMSSASRTSKPPFRVLKGSMPNSD